MKQKTFLSLLTLVIVASMSLSACQPAATPTPAPAATEAATTAPAATEAATTAPVATETPATAQPGGQLVWTETGGYYTLDPFVSPWHATPQYAVFDTMLALKPDLSTYVGDLVTDTWETAADNLSVTFHVKPGITFTDGTPVDATALKWNLDHYADKKVAAPNGGWMIGVFKEATAPDASTLVVTLDTPYAPLFSQLAGMEIVSPTAYQALGPDKFALAPVGAGPWKVKTITPDNSVLYERNPDYKWAPSFNKNAGPEYPDTLLVKYLSDDGVMFAALETGEVTFAPISAQNMAKATADKNITIVKGQENGGVYLGFNTQFKPFDDAKLRNAIAIGINRDEIIQAGYSGQAVPVYTALAQSEMGFSKEIDAAAQANSNDLAKAKQALDDAGYKAGADGIRTAPDGKKLEFTLTVRTEEEFKPVAEALQGQLLDMGIKVNIEVKEAQVIKQMTIDGTHQLILWNYGLLDPSILTYLFHSKNLGASDRTRFVNPDMDKLLNAADGAMAWADRQQKVAAVLQFLVDNHPNIPLYSRLSYIGYRNDQITGLQTDALADIYWNDAYMLKK
jgi:peptide/nickel transport system substrate-binding protein